jgi:hypothetical protein
MPLLLLGNSSVKKSYRGNEYTRNNVRIILSVASCPHRIRGDPVGLPVYLLTLVGSDWVNTFSRQRGVVRGVVLYAVRVVSRKVGDSSQNLLLSHVRPVILREMSQRFRYVYFVLKYFCEDVGEGHQ